MPVFIKTLFSRHAGTTALILYGAISFVFFGLRVVVRDASFVGANGDSTIFIWSFGWWPHAVLQGDNPVITHAIWAPSGVDLAWASSVPGLAFLFAPITLLFGAVSSFNAAALLMPALAAWACFLLCRELTGSTWASLVGGYLFGFSSYMLGHETGHLNLTSVFSIPLVALVLVQRARGLLSRRSTIIRLTPLLVLQLLISTEVLLTMTTALVLTLALGYAATFIVGSASHRVRHGIRGLLIPTVIAYVAAGALASPFLYFVLSDFEPHSINYPYVYKADLLNVIVPTKLTAINLQRVWTVAERFAGDNDGERTAYLGLPTLAVVVMFVWQLRRRWYSWFLAASLLIALILSLGASLVIGGRAVSVRLPFSLAVHLPLFNNVLPARFTLYGSLAAAVIVAIWTGTQRSVWSRYALPAASVVALLPNPTSQAWVDTANTPTFFRQGLYRSCLYKGENIVARPYRGASDSMLWQAESGFWYEMAGGYIGPTIPETFADFPAAYGSAVASDRRLGDILDLARAKHATAIVADGPESAPFRLLLPRSATTVGGVSTYHAAGFGTVSAATIGGVRLYWFPEGRPRSASCLRAVQSERQAGR